MRKRIGFITIALLFSLIFQGNLCFSQGIEIESGASITMSGAASIEIEDGGFINDGTYTADADTVTFSGTSADSISGSSVTDFYILNNSNSGGMLIDSSAAVTVSNSFTNTGTFSIDSDASGSGSFIVSGTSSGNVSYNRYMTGVDKWHLISSPVSGQNIEGFVVTNAATNAIATSGTKYGLAPYDEASQIWNYYSTSAGSNDIASAGNFTNGKGYEVLRTSDGKVTFEGALNTSNVSIGVTAAGNAWNLVGNPFTSAIHTNESADASNNLLTTNLSQLNASYGAIYFWDAENSNYITVNQVSGATYVAPGQAFFVYSKAGGGTISITEAMQTHQTGTTLKSTQQAKSIIKLIAEYNQQTSSTQIIYTDNMTTGLDPAYDAGRFSGGNNSFAVYTHLVGDSNNKVDFDIQCLPKDDYSSVIPVGLNAPENAEVMLRIQSENLPSDVPVFLEDKVTGEFIDLRESGSFYKAAITDKAQGIGRFYLHTKSVFTGTPSVIDGLDVVILPYPIDNCIRITGNIEKNARVILYDISGRQLINNSLENSDSNKLNMSGLKSGVYHVAIHSSTQKISTKIHWINLK